MGHEVDDRGIRIPDSRVEAVRKFPQPRKAKELERFLGLYAYVHRFIPKASQISLCLHKLRRFKKQSEFLDNWTNDHSKAFEKVKQAVTKAMLLVHQMDNARTEIWTDACDKGIGAVLMQFQINGWVPLAYWSKSFNNAQKSCSAFDKKLLALSYSVDHFRCYVESVPIVVRTDHKLLVSVLKNKMMISSPHCRDGICQGFQNLLLG